jgi:mono/diheme cytochrome c family protein
VPEAAVRIGHVALGFVLALLLVTAFAVYAWRPAIAPIERPSPSVFDAGLIAKGAALAAIGNCNTCHTAAGGASYAGGRPLQTPYGTVYGVNITPDPETGLGRWSEAAFTRAVREGVSRDGRHLYPAFPYDHYAKMPDEDVRALYAFIMTRDPVSAGAPVNDLRFPFNIRMLIAGWKALCFPAASASDETQSAEWNRGAYLVHGPAHCGSCHTPRNLLGAEKQRSPLAGGEVEGWHAPALSAESPAPVPWNAETLYRYLRQGHAERHPVAAGPMAEVVRNLASAPEQEVRAIAAYVATLAGEDTSERRERTRQVLARAGKETGSLAADADPSLQGGRATYAHACASCHGADGRGASSGSAMNLALSTTLYLPTSRNLLQIILDGIVPPEGERGRWMPGFGGALTDQQVVQLAGFLRTEFARAPAWRQLEDDLRKVERDRERQLAAAETR